MKKETLIKRIFALAKYRSEEIESYKGLRGIAKKVCIQADRVIRHHDAINTSASAS